MRRLATTSRPPGGAVPPWVELRNVMDYYRRQWNKMMGCPITKDIGTLNTLISRLRTHTESQLGMHVKSVIVATPSMRGLDWRDLQEAINYAGLKSLHDDTCWRKYRKLLLHSPPMAMACVRTTSIPMFARVRKMR